MIVNKFNANRGYKNYTHRMISLLKGMGYTFGGNLSTGSAAEDRIEKETTKAIAQNRNDMELQDATKLSLAIMPNHEQAAFIKGKLEAVNRGDDTVEVTPDERDSLKKYNLLETVKLLHPENPKILC